VILIDSNILIDALKKKQKVVASLENYREEGFGISVLSIYEVKIGIFILREEDPNFNVERRLTELENLVQTCEVYSADNEIATRGSEIMADLIIKGQVIDPIDVLIGSTFFCRDCSALLTQNKEHFDRIPGLNVIVP
jgi:tRNA(fMet)-specific endonuclease VapC